MRPSAAEDKQPAERQGHLWGVLEALPLGKHLLGAIPPSSSSVGMGGTLDCRDQGSKGRGQPLIWRVSGYMGGGLIFRSFNGLGFPAADACPGEGEMTSSTCRCQRLGVLGPSIHLPGSSHPLNAVNVDSVCRDPLPKVALQGGTNQLASVCPGHRLQRSPECQPGSPPTPLRPTGRGWLGWGSRHRGPRTGWWHLPAIQSQVCLLLVSAVPWAWWSTGPSKSCGPPLWGTGFH